MKITECEGYKKLSASVESDEQRGSGAHDYRGKLAWTVARAEHYAQKTGLSAIDILNAWEKSRDYWYMNYYQDANQPEIKGDNVRVFDTVEDLKAAIGEAKFRCPSCGGVSTNPYECNASQDCNWKSYGLFGTMGKGANVFVKSELRGQEIFTPVAWEHDNAKVADESDHDGR
ncbi:MAG: hypothetical protein KJ958_00860 [Gammaproteobacteria bacterium]|nr:hypothetical protein [Gammaproteobacteria bacterium]MBU1977697.1 hypothetical protein [Gammaproteobacteria bacterium]